MATLESPPSRYRIVEKGGRLIVTDTVTGQRNASADLPTMGDIARGRTASVAPVRSAAKPGVARDSSADAAPSTPRTKRRGETVRAPTAANQAKLIALVIVAIAILAALMISGLWVAVVIALLIPQVRAPMFEAGRTAFKRWFAA